MSIYLCFFEDAEQILSTLHMHYLLILLYIFLNCLFIIYLFIYSFSRSICIYLFMHLFVSLFIFNSTLLRRRQKYSKTINHGPLDASNDGAPPARTCSSKWMQRHQAMALVFEMGNLWEDDGKLPSIGSSSFFPI